MSTALWQASRPRWTSGSRSKFVEPGGDDLALGERLGQGLLVDDRAARGIHQHGRGLDEGKAPGADQMAGLRGEVGAEGDEVRLAEQIVQVSVLGLEFLFRLGGQLFASLLARLDQDAS